MGTLSQGSSPTPCPIPPPRCSYPASQAHGPSSRRPRHFTPGPGACPGRDGVKVTFRAPSRAGGGAQGAAGIGAPRSPAPALRRVRPNFLPRPRPAPSAALAPRAQSAGRAATPRLPQPPPARQPGAPCPRSGNGLTRTHPALPARRLGRCGCSRNGFSCSLARGS